jgi:hypothetical protein
LGPDLATAGHNFDRPQDPPVLPMYQLFCVGASVPALGASTLTVATYLSPIALHTVLHSSVHPPSLALLLAPALHRSDASTHPAVLHSYLPSPRPRPSIAPDRRLVHASSRPHIHSLASPSHSPNRMHDSLLVHLHRPPQPAAFLRIAAPEKASASAEQ